MRTLLAEVAFLISATLGESRNAAWGEQSKSLLAFCGGLGDSNALAVLAMESGIVKAIQHAVSRDEKLKVSSITKFLKQATVRGGRGVGGAEPRFAAPVSATYALTTQAVARTLTTAAGAGGSGTVLDSDLGSGDGTKRRRTNMDGHYVSHVGDAALPQLQGESWATLE